MIPESDEVRRHKESITTDRVATVVNVGVGAFIVLYCLFILALFAWRKSEVFHDFIQHLLK